MKHFLCIYGIKLNFRPIHTVHKTLDNLPTNPPPSLHKTLILYEIVIRNNESFSFKQFSIYVLYTLHLGTQVPGGGGGAKKS